jgi:arylsulfatase A-like enzyme
MPLIARWVGHIPAGRVSAVELMSADWLPTVASLAGAQLLPAPGKSPLMGADRAAAFVPGAGSLPVRLTPVMWDYRADGYGYCWNQAPRLAILQGDLKLHMNLDRSRTELYNVSAATFEADSIAHEQPAEVERLATILTAWAKTLDPIPPGTMSANSKHAGCTAYVYPRSGGGGPDHGGDVDYIAALHREAELDPYRV